MVKASGHTRARQVGGHHRRGRRSHEGRHHLRACKICHERRRGLQERLREKIENGGSWLIRGEGKTAGGHRPRGGGIRSPEKDRKGLQRPLPVSPRKDPFFHGFPAQTNFLLLWLRQGRRGLQLCDGHREVRVSGGRETRCPEMRDSDSASTGALAGGEQRK